MARRDAGDGAALDPALAQKKRARRRLVGAIVIGLAAAVLLPLLLDSEPRQTITDVQIEIPPRDAPLPPKLADAADPPSAVPDADRDSAPAAPPTSERGANSVATVPQAVPPLPSPEAGANDAVPPAASASKQPARQVDKPADKPKPADRPKQADAAKVAIATTTASDAAKPAAPHFALQVGAFANPGSARAQLDKVRKSGVSAYTETVQTAQGARTRVRVGPFATREAAEQARAKLQLAGITSAVVTP